MAKQAPTFYVFHGSDEFSIAETLGDFKRRLGPPDMVDLNTTVLSGRDLTLSELRHACDAIPFLADRRLVIVTNLLKRLTARGDRELARSLAEFLGALVDYLPHLPETTRLVFVEHEGKRNRLPGKRNRLPAKHPVVRLARQHERGYARRFDSPQKNDLRRWVEERARKYGGTIERRAADQLAIAVGGNLRLLDQEIAKLVTYTDAERQITSADVDTLVPYVQEGRIFDFVDALGQRDARAATQVLHSLMDPRGTNVPWIFGMIVRQFRLLIQVKELEDSGSSLQDVIKTLKLHPFPARKLHLQAIHFTSPQLEATYRHLLDTDLAIKTSKLTPALAMDLLVADLAATEL